MTGRRTWLALLLGLAIAGAALGQHPRRAIDLRVYLTAASRFVAGEPLYRAEDGHLPFKYAPAVAWLFAPLAALPGRVAGAVWNVGSVAALAATAVMLSRWRARGREAGAAWTAAALALLHPLWLELHYGQVDLVMGLLLVAAAWLSVRGRDGVAGACLAVAVLLKPPAAVLGLFFVREGRWRTLVAAAVAGAVLWVPVVLRYGGGGLVALTQAWVGLVAESTAPWALGHNPQGLPTLVLEALWRGDGVPTAPALSVAQGLAAAGFAGAVLAAGVRGPALAAVCCLGVALLSPLAWRANFVLALPLAVLAWEAEPGWRRVGGRAVVAVLGGVGLVVSEAVLGRGDFGRVMLWRPFAWCFVGLGAWGLVALREPRVHASPRPDPSPQGEGDSASRG